MHQIELDHIVTVLGTAAVVSSAGKSLGDNMMDYILSLGYQKLRMLDRFIVHTLRRAKNTVTKAAKLELSVS